MKLCYYLIFYTILMHNKGIMSEFYITILEMSLEKSLKNYFVMILSKYVS